MFKFAFVAAVGGLCVSSFAVELVQNGSFENPAQDGSWITGNPDGAYLPGSFSNWSASGLAGYGSPFLVQAPSGQSLMA